MSMKRVLYLVLKNTQIAYSALEQLKRDGFNMTLVSSDSLRHMMDDFPEDHHFLTLRDVENKENQESLMCIFVGDEDKVEQIKQSIRLTTNNFKDVHGFMFTKKIEDYEGSI